MTDLGFALEDPFSEASREPTNAVIYGIPGSGKTALALTAPSPLLIDFEKGGRSTARAVLAPGTDARIVKINYAPNSGDGAAQAAVDQLSKVVDFLRNGDHQFKSVIVDPVGELQKLLMAYTIEKFPMRRPMGGQPQIGDWGHALDAVQKFVATLRALPMHTIIVAHAEQPGNELDDIHPLVTGRNFGPFLEGAMDLLAYLYVETEQTDQGPKEKRVLRVATDGRIRAKNRGGKLPALVANPNLTKIFARMEG